MSGRGKEGGPVVEWIESASDEAGRAEARPRLARDSHAIGEKVVRQECGIGEHVSTIHHAHDRAGDVQSITSSPMTGA
jgi:hypothetical protein